MVNLKDVAFSALDIGFENGFQSIEIKKNFLIDNNKSILVIMENETVIQNIIARLKLDYNYLNFIRAPMSEYEKHGKLHLKKDYESDLNGLFYDISVEYSSMQLVLYTDDLNFIATVDAEKNICIAISTTYFPKIVSRNETKEWNKRLYEFALYSEQVQKKLINTYSDFLFTECQPVVPSENA